MASQCGSSSSHFWPAKRVYAGHQCPLGFPPDHFAWLRMVRGTSTIKSITLLISSLSISATPNLRTRRVSSHSGLSRVTSRARLGSPTLKLLLMLVREAKASEDRLAKCMRFRTMKLGLAAELNAPDKPTRMQDCGLRCPQGRTVSHAAQKAR